LGYLQRPVIYVFPLAAVTKFYTNTELKAKFCVEIYVFIGVGSV